MIVWYKLLDILSGPLLHTLFHLADLQHTVMWPPILLWWEDHECLITMVTHCKLEEQYSIATWQCWAIIEGNPIHLVLEKLTDCLLEEPGGCLWTLFIKGECLVFLSKTTTHFKHRMTLLCRGVPPGARFDPFSPIHPTGPRGPHPPGHRPYG